MAIEVTVLGKYKEAYGLEVDVNYTCPHCGTCVTESICFEKNLKDCIAVMDNHACPDCGKSNDLEVDLY